MCPVREMENLCEDSNNADEEEHSVIVKTSGDTGEYKWPRNNSLETWYHTHPHFGSGF